MEATTLQAAGYEVSIISPVGRGYERAYELLDGVHIYRHPLPPDMSSVRGYLTEYATALWWEWRLARRIRRERGFETIHICNPPDLLFLVAVWFKLIGGVSVIYDQHDLSPEMYEAKYGRRGPFYWILRWAERLTFAFADLVITTNESHREIAQTRGHKKSGNVFVVRSAPRLESFQPVAPNPSLKHGRRFLVGYVGVMGEPEGIDLLLESARHITEDLGRKDVTFTLIGSGPQAGALLQMRDRMGLADVVRFTGRVTDQEMIEILSTADVCVAPDVKNPYNDRCTMNKVLEYMALSKPIVQFDLVEGRRSAQGAAVYARPNDPFDFARSIIALLDDPDRRSTMGETGRRRMESELEWRHQQSTLLAAYDAL